MADPICANCILVKTCLDQGEALIRAWDQLNHSAAKIAELQARLESGRRVGYRLLGARHEAADVPSCSAPAVPVVRELQTCCGGCGEAV